MRIVFRVIILGRLGPINTLTTIFIAGPLAIVSVISEARLQVASFIYFRILVVFKKILLIAISPVGSDSEDSDDNALTVFKKTRSNNKKKLTFTK